MSRLPIGIAAFFLIAAGAAAQDTVPIGGVVSPRALRMGDGGPVDAATRLSYMRMMFAQTAAQKSSLARLLSDQQDPTSVQYHRWLTPEEYADRFGLSQTDVNRIAAWLTSAGFTIEYTARGHDWIAFTGTAGQVEKAFQTSVHQYRENGETHIAIAKDPSVPANLSPLIAGFLGMDDFRPHSMAMLKPNYTSGGSHTLAPGDLATIYNFSSLYSAGIDGTGQKIVIVGQTNIYPSDIAAFRSQYGLSATNIQILQEGAGDPGFNSDDLIEADLDLEWAGAIARNATLIYVYSDSANGSAIYAIDQNLAPVVSESFGGCEADYGTSSAASYESQAVKGNTLGISWIVASGDSGAAGCDPSGATAAKLGLAVNMPAAVPEVTAVGGTEFNEGTVNYWSSTNGANGGSATGYIPEKAWNDTPLGYGLASTGGGVSTLYPKPSWQSGSGVPADGHRDLPDLAMPAANDHDPYNIYSAGQAALVGGTSVATPVFAGLVALLNQYQKTSGSGNLNQNLYKLAVSSPAMFHDVQAGNNIVPCVASSPSCVNGDLGYSAGANYDLTTGLGSVNAYNLVTGWNGTTAGLAITSLSPSSVTAGGASFTLTVNGSGFASGAAILWAGTALTPTNFISATQLTATVSGTLVASAGTVSVAVSSGGKTSGAVSFTINAASVPATFSTELVTAQAPPASGCVLPSSVTSFTTTDATVYLYFDGTTGVSDLISFNWLAPDGSTVAGASWPQQAGSFCFTGASLAISNLATSKLGAWQARVYDNGTVAFTVPFTVSATGTAVPVIGAVRNGASYTSGTVSPGEIVSIVGTGMGPVTLVSNTFNSSGILGAQLSGTTVTFNGVSAPLIYTSATAVAAIVPYEVYGAANAQVVVNYQGRLSSTVTIPIAASAPGVFTANASGTGPTASLNQTGLLNSASAPETPGSVIVFYATGEGQLTPGGVDGKIAGSPVPHPILPVTVTIGGVAAAVSYAGSAPGEIEGLMQINAVIPRGVYGASVPIVVQVGTAQSQSGATIAVVAANSAFAVTSEVTSATPPEDSSGNLLCSSAPASKTAFLTTDASAWVWFTFNGAQNGDTLTFKWILPSGAIDTYQPILTVPFNGSGCAAAALPISGQAPASEPGIWQIQLYRDGVLQFTNSFSVEPPPSTFAVTAMETAAALIPDANGNPNYCATPTSKNAFLTTDASVYAWFTYNGVQTGDVFTFNWIHPSGAVDSYQPTTTLTFSGSGCTAWAFGIAGQEAATEPGPWQAKVFRNGALLFTLPFTISAPASFTVTSELTAAGVSTTASGSLSCTAPTAKSAFLTTDPAVWIYFTFANAALGDVLTYKWIHPSGLVDANQASSTLGFSGSGCADWVFDIAGQEAAQEPGVWQAQVFRNGTLTFTLPFTIATPGGFVVTSQLTANSVSTSASGSLQCTAPVSATTFPATQPFVYVYFTYNNVALGDVFTYDWIQPSGALDGTPPTSTLSFSGSGCSDYSLGIAGQLPASEPGTWQVRVLRNGSPVFTLPFCDQLIAVEHRGTSIGKHIRLELLRSPPHRWPGRSVIGRSFFVRIEPGPAGHPRNN